ncbi:hypothetical protein ES703_28042 [subsurface metagenome]
MPDAKPKLSKLKLWINRIFALVIGGGLVFLIMNASVVKNIKMQHEQLKEDFYGAGRLLDNAKAFFEDKDYDNAQETLNTLFEKHPASDETTEGKRLYTTIEGAINKEQEEQEELDEKWKASEDTVREEWEKVKAAQIREQLETDMSDALDREWDKIKDNIREEWEESIS